MNNNIFLSYSWSNRESADIIEKDLKPIGKSLRRDIRDFPKFNSLKESMKKNIGEADFVILLLSKNYLESPNCMYEAMELVNRPNAEKLLLPIVVDDTVFEVMRNGEYNDFWENKKKEAEDKMHKHPHDVAFKKALEEYEAIYKGIGKFINIVSDINNSSLEELKKENYKSLLEKTGIDINTIPLFIKVLKISEIEDIEDRGIAIDNFLIKFPNNAIGYMLRASFAEENKEYKKAIVNYNIAKELNPSFSVLVYYNRGCAKYAIGKLEEAIADFDKAISLNQNEADVYINRGLAKDDLGKTEESIADYNMAIDLKPNDFLAYYNRGISMVKLGKLEEGIADYDIAIALNPNDNESYFQRGSVKMDLGEYEAAIADFDIAISLQPNESYYYNFRGIAKGYLEDFKEAIADFGLAIAINQNYSEAYYNKGLSYEKLEKIEEAEADFKKAQELGFNPET